MSLLKKYNIDKIFIINLDSRTDRFLKMKQMLRDIGETNYEIFPAFDSKKLILRPISSHMVRQGAMCCSLSHLAILKIAKMKNYNRILILEDDCQLNELISEVNNIPDNFDIALLGWSERKYKIDSLVKWDGIDDIIGTHAMLINQSAYNTLIKQLYTMNNHWDMEVTKLKDQLNIIKHIPAIFTQSNDDSSIHPDMINFTDTHWYTAKYADKLTYLSHCNLPITNDVAVIIPSPELLAVHGDEIDKHSTVFRFNKWPLTNQIGTKTTHIITHNNMLVNNDKHNQPNFYKEIKGKFLLYNDDPSGEGLKNKIKYVSTTNPMFVLDLQLNKEIKDNFNISKPTSGFTLVYLLIKNGIKPTIYGFSTGIYDYYWINQNINLIDKQHDKTIENELFIQWHTENKITLFNYENDNTEIRELSAPKRSRKNKNTKQD